MLPKCPICVNYNKTIFDYPCRNCSQIDGHMDFYKPSNLLGYAPTRTIFDKAKGEIDTSNYLFSGEEAIKPGEKLNFGRNNGKTFYSIISGPMKIKNVIFNDPATIVLWGDGTKTVVKCGENDTFDPEKGLAMAISKKLYGNKGNYYNVIKKWLPEEYKEPYYEVVEKNTKVIEKTCYNCLHGNKKGNESPCFMCLHTISPDHTCWEAKEK